MPSRRSFALLEKQLEITIKVNNEYLSSDINTTCKEQLERSENYKSDYMPINKQESMADQPHQQMMKDYLRPTFDLVRMYRTTQERN
jgi:hypothetical protein